MDNRKARVLIVEDDFALSNLWQTALQYLMSDVIDGVDACYDGQTAVDRVRTEPPPDLIILDMHLPLRSGQEVFQVVRTDPRLGDVKIVVITADAPLAEHLRRELSGPHPELLPPDSILVKPVDMDTFQASLASILPGAAG